MYSMKEVCQETHLTYEALKYYCNEGLIPHVQRDKNNRRIFDDNNVAWIKSLTCFKKCGMSILDIKEYLALCLEGESSIPKRKIILENKQKDLQLQINELQESIAYIDWKQGFYDDVLSGKTKYFSHLIATKEE